MPSRTTVTRSGAVLLLSAVSIGACGAGESVDSPVAASDWATTQPDTQVVLSLVANDFARPPATLDLTSLDLEPARPGAQSETTTDAGFYLLNCTGDVLFIPAPGFTGVAAASYTIADSLGQVSTPARIVVNVRAD